MIYSFDVFDTCIVRSCGKPDNIFRLLAEEVVQDKDESLLRAFAMERKNAEKNAMLSLGKEAVTLDEIYDVFNLALFTNMPKTQVQELEIALELRSFAPIKNTVEMINSLRNKGEILFISDMYLPDKVIQKCLTSLEIMQEGECLYVSGSIGLSKHTGRLFDYVAQAKSIKKSTWVHHGDNLHSDYFVPKRKGIKARLVRSGYSVYETFIENEAKFFSSPLAASIFAGLMHAERLKGRNDDGGFVANIMAPLLVPFVDALLKDATAKHIRRLYFASRDAYIMYLIAKEFSPIYKDVEVHYLHISTKSVYPAYVFKADKEEILYLLKYIGNFFPRKIMLMFGFTDKEIQDMGYWSDMNVNLHFYRNQKQVILFVEKLLEGDNKKKIKTRCAAKRELLKKYFLQQGFYAKDNTPVGLIDLGWRCTSQEILQKILDSHVEYYYWGVSEKRIEIGKVGAFTSFFYGEDFEPQIYRNNKFIEFYICRSTEGTTLEYKQTAEGIAPILAEREPSALDEEITQNHKAVLCFAQQYSQYPCLQKHSQKIFHTLFLRILFHFTQYPDKKIVAFLANKMYWRNFWDKPMPIITKIYPWTILLIIVTFFMKNKRAYTYKYRAIWLEASFVHTYGKLGIWLSLCTHKIMSSQYIKYQVKRLLNALKDK